MSATRPAATVQEALDAEGLAIAGRREFTIGGDGEQYAMRLLDVPIEFELDHVRRDRGDLWGQLTVRTSLVGAKTHRGILSVGTFNCSSTQVRYARAKALKDMSQAPQIDWARLLEEFCIRVLDAESTGQPAITLCDVPPSTPDDALDVDGIRIFDKHPIILFGDGGVAKSYLALYIAGRVAQQGLTVLYADWELDAADHRFRLERMFGAEMPQRLIYARCSKPLTSEADRLARLVRQHDVSFLVCDSIGYACDGPPEAAEVALRYNQVVRRLGVGSLHLAHTNKSDDADKKPFGSAFWHNSARATWNVKRSETESHGDQIAVVLTNRKANIGALLPAVAFQIDFAGDATRIARVDATMVDDLAAELPLWQRMRMALRTRPETIATLAEELKAKVDTVERTARRYPKLFTRVSGEDRIARLALVEHR